jgi:hypothetical protein
MKSSAVGSGSLARQFGVTIWLGEETCSYNGVRSDPVPGATLRIWIVKGIPNRAIPVLVIT